MQFTTGNLLEADIEAVVNTVNTVGVMGKGIALMFKERYPANFKAYAAACERGEVQVGRMFVTESLELSGPRWIINFPTKRHWRGRTRFEWVEQGLEDLCRVIIDRRIRSIAIPPLGCGSGGLDWGEVRPAIERALGDLQGVRILVFEPTRTYQNVAKNVGVEKLTPARAMIAEMVRRYGLLGLDCSILEVQKLAWFLERVIERSGLANPLDLQFVADRYGPFAYRLTHLLNALDGSYLHCDKRLADASPFDAIHFNTGLESRLQQYFKGPQGAPFAEAIEATDRLIDGFQSPLGMEVLATVDWLIARENAEASVEGIRKGLALWPAGEAAARRKQSLFDDKLIAAAVERIAAA